MGGYDYFKHLGHLCYLTFCARVTGRRNNQTQASTVDEALWIVTLGPTALGRFGTADGGVPHSPLLIWTLARPSVSINQRRAGDATKRRETGTLRIVRVRHVEQYHNLTRLVNDQLLHVDAKLVMARTCAMFAANPLHSDRALSDIAERHDARSCNHYGTLRRGRPYVFKKHIQERHPDVDSDVTLPAGGYRRWSQAPRTQVSRLPPLNETEIERHIDQIFLRHYIKW
ncbi:hypothetical protein BC827DRAFT_1268403 [Russula dissimulans]|nr:hypothetical protein BC827DRAFT_1268403 [Russula dissimulans]